MWQRVQTLYLAISTILIAVMLFSNEAVCLGSDGAVADAIRFTDKVSHLIMLIIILLLNFMALTIVKHRVFQMRTAVLAAIITLALQIWIVLDYFSIHEVYVFKLPAIFPVVCIIDHRFSPIQLVTVKVLGSFQIHQTKSAIPGGIAALV